MEAVGAVRAAEVGAVVGAWDRAELVEAAEEAEAAEAVGRWWRRRNNKFGHRRRGCYVCRISLARIVGHRRFAL